MCKRQSGSGWTTAAAIAAAKIPDGDGYLAALVNYRFIANAVWTTDEAVARMKKKQEVAEE